MQQISSPLVSMHAISKRFGDVLANDRVDLDLHRGEVHGLLGENGAGKSTLMHVLTGLYQPDGGTIHIHGERVDIRTPRHAHKLGIGMVHQHFMLVPDMSVAENVALAASPETIGLDLRGVTRRVRELADRYELKVNPAALCGDLSVGERQRVEILKLLFLDSQILIMDEPTAVLTPQEWTRLAQLIRDMAHEGRSIVLITHKLGELLDVTDTCTVLRDGKRISTVSTSQTDSKALAQMMVGRDVVIDVERPSVEVGDIVIRCEKVGLDSAAGSPLLRDVSFEIRQGEVLGVAGVAGNGQNELTDILTGIASPTHGMIHLNGKEYATLTPRLFKKEGGALIPEDRQGAGLAADLTVAENLVMKDFRDTPYSRVGLLAIGRIRSLGRQLVETYDIRPPDPEARAAALSGGNQQKVVLARELHRDPKLIIAVQPTRGLDIGAIEATYGVLNRFKCDGGAILLISTELQEILTLADRVIVMYGGSIAGTMPTSSADTARLGLLMGGQR